MTGRLWERMGLSQPNDANAAGVNWRQQRSEGEHRFSAFSSNPSEICVALCAPTAIASAQHGAFQKRESE